MKRLVILIGIFLFPCMGIVHAQTQNQKQQVAACNNQEHSKNQAAHSPMNPMMLKMKKTFIQENFVLDSSSQAAFWNAYNQYEKRVLAIHKAQREYRKQHQLPRKLSADSLNNLSDEIIIHYYDSKFSTQNQIFQADETFYQDLKKCLTAKQIAQYYLLEKSFRKSAVKAHHGAGKATTPVKATMKHIQAVPAKSADKQ